MISLNQVEKIYRTSSVETLALHNINIEVPEGSFLSIMGPSGSGKSTLLNIMGLIDAPTEGEVLIGGNNVVGMSEKEMARLRNKMIGFVFQSFHLIADLSVVDNVELPLIYRKMTAGERQRRALDALAKVGLSARTKHFPTQLSGGQCQRVAVARAIVSDPKIILADEPTGNLDSNMSNEIMEILLTLNKEEKVTIAIVTHNEEIADRTNRIIRLFDGSQVS
ncbi:MAG: ABC transporter ATP-binding protein [candidate division Zixibacteria bacterium]|nr:ABC transporter ATP-binding protein [candidate division Zixibacteria bacterium]